MKERTYHIARNVSEKIHRDNSEIKNSLKISIPMYRYRRIRESAGYRASLVSPQIIICEPINMTTNIVSRSDCVLT